MGVVLGIYLFRVGLSSLVIGFIIAAGLAGSALATVVMTLAADRMGRKQFLVLLSLLSAVGGIALATAPSLPFLVMLAFVGMLNGTGTDRSAAFALDQAVVPGLVSDVANLEPGLVQRPSRRRRIARSVGRRCADRPSAPFGSLRAQFLPSRVLWLLRAMPRCGCDLLVPLASGRDRRSVDIRLGESQDRARKQENRCEVDRSVFAGRIRRGLFDRRTGCLLVLPALRNGGTGPRHGLLRCTYPERLFTSWSGLAGSPHRTCEYHGLHPPAVQPFPHGRAVCPFLQMGSFAFSLSGSSSRDGCSHAPVVCGRARETERANLREWNHKPKLAICSGRWAPE